MNKEVLQQMEREGVPLISKMGEAVFLLKVFKSWRKMCFSQTMEVVKRKVGAVEIDREIKMVGSGSSKLAERCWLCKRLC